MWSGQAVFFLNETFANFLAIPFKVEKEKLIEVFSRSKVLPVAF
jgi:hypothetical protein